MTVQATNSNTQANMQNIQPLLTFRTAGQICALPVSNIVRIIDMVALTYLPGAPEVIAGLLNVQGKVVPVIDLRLRFGLPRQPYNLETPIIITSTSRSDRTLALIADTVEEVVEVSSHQLTSLETIIPAEQAVQNVTSAAFFAGVATIEQKLILVLNVDDLLSLTEQKVVLQALGNHDEIKS